MRMGLRIPSAESNEFPNDNPALHQGASWICLDPLAAPRLVARPAVIAKAAAERAVPEARPSDRPRSTLLPPAPSPAEIAAQAEADEFVAKFLARVSTLPPAPRVPDEIARAQRMAPIAQLMLDGLPSYKVRRAAARVPPPPAHVYSALPVTVAPPGRGQTEPVSSSIGLDPVARDLDSPLALVESWLPPAPVAELVSSVESALPMEMPAVRPPMELAWRAESPWSVVVVEPHAYRTLGWDSLRPIAVSEPIFEAEVQETTAQETVATEESAPSSLEDPIVEVVQLMEVAPTPEAPAVEEAPAAAVLDGSTGVSGAAESEIAVANSESANVYDSFVAALSAVLLQRGATRGAAVVASLLDGARLEVAALGETLVQQLSSAGIGEQRGEQFCVEGGFAQVASGWRALLSDESADFSSCAETLDDWATRVVGALLPSPAPAKDIRRELRRKGVAAFGMLAAA